MQNGSALATHHRRISSWHGPAPSRTRSAIRSTIGRISRLKRYFDIDELLDESSAETIWELANQRLAEADLSVHGILRKFDVKRICTTDDPVDDLRYHIALAESDLPTRVRPAFRPDAALRVDQPVEFNAYVDRLGTVVDHELTMLDDLINALKSRHDYFHEHGCRLSDHGLERCYAEFPSEREARAIFDKVRVGTPADANERAAFISHMMLHFARWDAEQDWTKQLHLGPLRNASAAALAELGRDTGFDSIGDYPQAASLARFLSTCEREQALPRTILYNNNPTDNYLFATMAGNFQDGTIGGKVQFGSAWWYLDQKQGMEARLRCAGQYRPLISIRWHVDGLAVVHVLSSARVLSSRTLQPDCRRHPPRRITTRLRAGWRDDPPHLLSKYGRLSAARRLGIQCGDSSPPSVVA